MNKKIDNIFNQISPKIEPFVFDQRVALVFDDMVSRSVPGYATMQFLIADLSLKLHQKNPILDLGCSTGQTALSIIKRSAELGVDLPNYIGLDSSEPMLNEARKKLKNFSQISLICQDISNRQKFLNFDFSVVILNLFLQFIPVNQRLELLKNLYQRLPPKGTLILVEKIKFNDPIIDALFTEYYYDFKREMGYSNLEIANKREALENVLTPLSSEENLDLLRKCKFSNINTFFQWFNFCGYVAIK